MSLPRALLALVLLVPLSACLYRLPVQQGNMLDQTQVEQLKTGMTKTQVRFLLGTPMVPDAFDEDRWDYYHYLDTGRGSGIDVTQTRRVTVWFKEGVVDRIEDSARVAGASEPAASAAQPTG